MSELKKYSPSYMAGVRGGDSMMKEHIEGECYMVSEVDAEIERLKAENDRLSDQNKRMKEKVVSHDKRRMLHTNKSKELKRQLQKAVEMVDSDAQKNGSAEYCQFCIDYNDDICAGKCKQAIEKFLKSEGK